MKNRHWLSCCLAVAIVLLPGSTATAQQLAELWVLNEGTRSISILDTNTETVVATISLGGLPAPTPYDLASSTLPGRAGDFVFITQGSNIVRIDTGTRLPVGPPIDVAALVGMPLVLKGCAAAFTGEFLDGGLPTSRTYLHVAADVDAGGGNRQPFALILDQAVLAGLTPPLAPALVSSVPLRVAGPDIEPMMVTVLGSPAGNHLQRAWYTLRDTPPTLLGRVISVLVGGQKDLALPFEVIRTEESVQPLGAAVPGRVRIGAPYDRELSLLPEAANGRILHLESGRSCTTAGAPLAADIAIADCYPYDAWSIILGDGVTLMNPVLGRINMSSCAQDTFPLGAGPTDVAVLDRTKWQRTFVSNRDDDTLTVVRNAGLGATTTATLALGPPPGGGCSLCPVALEVIRGDSDSCLVENISVTELTGGDALITWQSSCPAGTLFEICKTSLFGELGCVDDGMGTLICDDPGPGPPTVCVDNGDGFHCPIPISPTGTPWERLGVTSSDEYTDTSGADGDYNVHPE